MKRRILVAGYHSFIYFFFDRDIHKYMNYIIYSWHSPRSSGWIFLIAIAQQTQSYSCMGAGQIFEPVPALQAAQRTTI
jgi:hypothetical protein